MDALNNGGATPEGGRGDAFGISKAISRRTVMKGAAWSVPAVALITAAPAYAASTNCPSGKFNTVGRGKLLSGGLFGLDLDTLLDVNGVIASAPALVTESGYAANGAASDPDTNADVISLTALSAININATGLTNVTLSSLLSTLLPANIGATNQYSYAASSGAAVGASGYVDNSGAIRFNDAKAGTPGTGTLSLKTLLTPLLGTAAALITQAADVQLQVGVLAGQANFADCPATTTPVTRQYLVSSLRIVITSPLLTAVVTALNDALSNGLVTAALGLLDIRIVPSALYGGSIPSGAGQPVQAQLDANPATLTIDLGTLFGGDNFGVDYSPWLNSQAPNTVLFTNKAPATDPVLAVTNFVSDLVTTLVNNVGNGIQLNVNGTWQTLNYLIANNILLKATAGAVLADLQTVLNSTLPAVVDSIGNDLLTPLFTALSATGVLNIRLNAQNNPASGNAGPGRWNTLPTGQYDVAALGISAISGPYASTGDSALDLFIARGSVGPDTAI